MIGMIDLGRWRIIHYRDRAGFFDVLKLGKSLVKSIELHFQQYKREVVVHSTIVHTIIDTTSPNSWNGPARSEPSRDESGNNWGCLHFWDDEALRGVRVCVNLHTWDVVKLKTPYSLVVVNACSDEDCNDKLSGFFTLLGRWSDAAAM